MEVTDEDDIKENDAPELTSDKKTDEVLGKIYPLIDSILSEVHLF